MSTITPGEPVTVYVRPHPGDSADAYQGIFVDSDASAIRLSGVFIGHHTGALSVDGGWIATDGAVVMTPLHGVGRL